MPTLRCPVCTYEYSTTMSGWAFRTNKNTKCVGLSAVQDGSISTMHAYNHPFEVVKEDPPAKAVRHK